MDWLIGLWYILFFVVASNPLGIVAIAVIYLLLSVSRLGWRKAIPYTCFFLAGVTVANFQWHIAFDEDRSGLVQYYFAAILLIPIVSVIGLLTSRRYLPADRLLVMIIGMTVLLGIMQFLAEASAIPSVLLNFYACAYAVMAMSLPFISLGWNHYAQRLKGANG
jgi:hypothetical protein